MNVRALQCFIKVYEKKSINAAAKEVFLSPQGLSKVIKQLEIDLEAELFSRGTQGMEATESGELLYARARHVCYLMEDIKKEIGIINGSTGALNVVMTYAASAAVPPDLIFGFSDKNPNIRIQLREYPDEHAVGDLFQEEADVGLVLGHEGIKDCHYDLLIPGEVVAVVARTHRLASQDEVTLAELMDETLVLRSVEEGRDHRLVEACLDAGLTPRIKYESGNILTLHHLVCTGGYAAISVNLIEAAVRDDQVKVLRLKDPIPENLFLVSRKREIQNKAVSLFKTYMLDLVRKRK
jgi:DNA-binding transcriptional LysR family regulator